MEREIKNLLKLSRPLEIGKTSTILHNFINLSCFFALIGLFWATCFISLKSSIFLTVSPILFGLLFFSFFILVVHEGSHLMFLVTKNIRFKRLINRTFAYPISALSFQDYIEDWEKGHLEHHRYPIQGNDKPDPQNCPSFIHDKDSLVRELKKIFFTPGYAFIKQNSCIKMTTPFLRKRILLGLIAWGSLLVFNILFFKWFLIIPQIISASITMGLNLVKVSMEHGGEQLTQENVFLRSRSTKFFGDKLIMPMNICLHFEHHLNMHVPWYRLRRFYDLTKKNCSKDFLNLVH